MKPVVVDASTLLKWVLPGSDEADVPQANAIAAAALAGRLRLLVPDLWYYEAGNILARRVPAQADGLLRHLDDLLVPWSRRLTGTTQTLALDLARRHGVTFYDASYHALALASDGVLVTADARYLAKAKADGGVILLADWPGG